MSIGQQIKFKDANDALRDVSPSQPLPVANQVGGAVSNNAAFSQKQAGFIGRMQGASSAASDGSMAVLTPAEGTFIPTTPGLSVVTALLRTLTAFTPSANKTTFTATLRGVQGRA